MLSRACFRVSVGDVGPSEIELLEIVEVNDRETRELQIIFDPGDLDTAYDELDRCHAAIEQLDEARVRFAELRPDPLRIPPNAATRAADRMHAAGDALDWDGVRTLCAPTLVYEEGCKKCLSCGFNEC